MSYLPDFCYRSQTLNAEGVVLHYFSGRYVDFDNRFDYEVCRNLLIDLNRPQSEREHYLLDQFPNRQYASYHWLIDRKGNAHQLVPVEKQAYHAGKSEINGRTNLNTWTFGISFIADQDSGFTDEQYQTAQTLCHRRHISPTQVWDHEMVAPDRKVDVGDKFDWNKFNRGLRAKYSGLI